MGRLKYCIVKTLELCNKPAWIITSPVSFIKSQTVVKICWLPISFVDYVDTETTSLLLVHFMNFVQMRHKTRRVLVSRRVALKMYTNCRLHKCQHLTERIWFARKVWTTSEKKRSFERSHAGFWNTGLSEFWRLVSSGIWLRVVL
jgi:hypothetical protein